MRRLAATRGQAIDLEVLQYGVTRQRLGEAMTAGGGPDVLHVSGHGAVGRLLLEHPDGSKDPVSTGELMRLLAPARHRVRLTVLSAYSAVWCGVHDRPAPANRPPRAFLLSV